MSAWTAWCHAATGVRASPEGVSNSLSAGQPKQGVFPAARTSFLAHFGGRLPGFGRENRGWKLVKVTIPASQNGVLAVLRGLQKWCFGAPMPASVARDVDVVSRSPCFRDSNKNVRFTCVEHVKGATSSPCCQHTLWIRGAFS